MQLYETLYKWNLWGEWQPLFGHPRRIVSEIVHYLEEPEVVSIVGPRRAGKSTVMYQIMQHLMNDGVDPKAILHVNFEEPALATALATGLLDDLYDTYRMRVFPKGKSFVFLDEIQNIDAWERWVRARNEIEDIKIIVTGSSSPLLSREFGTLLTGRHLTIEVYPLDFRDQLAFRNIEIPKEPYSMHANASIKHAVLDYLKWGGMPRIVLSDDTRLRERLLSQYFDDILYRDVIMRHSIRDAQVLRNIAVYLLTQTASMISYRRISDLFNVSQALVQSYCGYLQEAFLVNLLQCYSLKTALRVRKPLKVHAIDLGLRQVVSFSQTSDECKLLESLVYRTLLDSKQDGIFYWHGDTEVDLVSRQGMEISRLIQVTFAGLDNEKTLRREIRALEEAGKVYPNAKKLLVIFDVPNKLAFKIPKTIEVVPVWWLLLNPDYPT